MAVLLSRRSCLLAWAAAPFARAAPDDTGPAVAALRSGGCVVAFRHALAPGTYDPPEMTLGDCRTQRNLNDEGRAQARRIGGWFATAGLRPAAVRSSPWCRCIDTAQGAFGRADAWAPLGSPSRSDAAARETQRQSLVQALAAVPAGRFEAWVTHNFVISDLCGVSTASAEGVVLKLDARGGPGAVQVLARIAPPG